MNVFPYLAIVFFAKPGQRATVATVRCACRCPMARPTMFNHFCIYVSFENFCFLYTYDGTIIQNFSHVRFLAHLSRRLTWWAYSIAMVRRPSVVHTFKLEYLWGQVANLDQIFFEASLGWGKGCIRFGGRSDVNSGFHGNRKLPLTCNGKNVRLITTSLLIVALSNLQVTRTSIKSRPSSISGQIGLSTLELLALERRNIFP